MAEFSKEYNIIVGDTMYDFSYLETYEEMKNGDFYDEICEGFGSIGLLKENDTPYLIFQDKGEYVKKQADIFISEFKLD